MSFFGYFAAGAAVGIASERPGCLVWPFNVALSAGLIWLSYTLLTWDSGDVGMRFAFVFLFTCLLVISLGKVISFGLWHLPYMVFDISIALGSLVGKILWAATLACVIWVHVSIFTGSMRGLALAWACVLIALAGLFSSISGRGFLSRLSEVRGTVSGILGFHLPDDSVTYNFRKGRTEYHVDVPYGHDLADENLRDYLVNNLRGYKVDFSGPHTIVLTRA